MCDTNTTVYKAARRETTEWDDWQRRLGNKPELEPEWEPDKFVPRPEIEADAAKPDATWLANVERTDEAEGAGDADGCADDRELEQLRRRRLAELRAGPAAPDFGGVVKPIGHADFVEEVTDPSARVWVVVLLYKPRHPECDALGACLDELARKHRHTKFVRIVSTECIPGYPDGNLPTLIVYRHRDVARSFVGVGPYGGRRFSPEGVAYALRQAGAFGTDEADADAQERERDRLRAEYVARVAAELAASEDAEEGVER